MSTKATPQSAASMRRTSAGSTDVRSLYRLAALRRERNGSRSVQRTRQLGEDRQVGVEPDPLDSPNAEREQRPIILEPTELPLDCGAPSVERLSPLRLARHQGMKAVRLDPSGGGGALPGGAPPLGPRTPRVGTGEPPLPMFAGRRLLVPSRTSRLRQSPPSRPRPRYASRNNRYACGHSKPSLGPFFALPSLRAGPPGRRRGKEAP